MQSSGPGIFPSFCSLTLFFGAILPLATAADAENFTVEKDIAYLGPDRAEKMDAYIPSAKFARPLPVVIWIHGGGWTVGDKAAGREVNVCSTLAENGYAAFSINYQLGTKAPERKADGTPPDPPKEPVKIPWPQNLYDCKSALRYVRQEATRFGIDPSRVAISGGSAGGHLSLLTGVTGNDAEINKGGLYTDQDNRVSCIIDFYGIPEITGYWVRTFTGANGEETKANLKAASFYTYLGSATPPVLVVHGTTDTLVNISMSRDLVQKLEASGTPHEFVEVPGAPHAFHLQPKEMDLRPVVLAFLEKYLGKPKLVSSPDSQPSPTPSPTPPSPTTP